MSFANENRKTTSSNKTNNSIRDIRIRPIVKNDKKFSEEIPEEFKYNSFWGKLQFWNKVSIDRWSWDKIPKDAKDLDAKFDCKKYQPDVSMDACEAAEKLKSDSEEYINKNKSYIKETDSYTDSDAEEDIIISKRGLLAKKMLKKLQYRLDLKEGAKNVILLPDKKNGRI